MTVKELRELLQGYDDDLEVLVTFDAGCCETPITGLSDPAVPSDRRVLVLDGV
jgi:hypothetical protein